MEGNSMSSDSEVIIGLYFGECVGDCAEMYLLKEGQIFADIIENGYSESPAFSSDALVVESNLLDDFNDIYSSTPDLLLDSSDTTYGCPDCGDWGAIHYQIDDRVWTLDNSLENNPEEIQDFVVKIQELIQAL